MNTIIYVNGNRVTKEELSNIEIRSDVINSIVAVLRKKNENREVAG